MIAEQEVCRQSIYFYLYNFNRLIYVSNPMPAIIQNMKTAIMTVLVPGVEIKPTSNWAYSP